MPARQFKWFLCTIPARVWNSPPDLPPWASYIKGQKEVGESGYEHWQLVIYFSRKVTLTAAKRNLPQESYLEPSRSSAALAYVWKDDTSVAGTRFEFGQLPVRRNESKDWERVWDLARNGDFSEIPAEIRVVHYRTLRVIRSDFATPPPLERRVVVYWGPTGTGKSRRAWDEAGLAAYPKCPRTKFWDGYQGQDAIVLDEFRGSIDVANLLRWFDRYPVNVEIKGSSVAFLATKIWITSNLDPRNWYPDLDEETREALFRRFTEVINFVSL